MPTANEIDAQDRRLKPAPASGWQVAWGLLLIVSGALAMVMPGIAALTTALFFAWLLIIGGAGELAYAIQARHQNGFGWKLASGVLTLVLGIAILIVPLAGVASLAMLVGAFLFDVYRLAHGSLADPGGPLAHPAASRKTHMKRVRAKGLVGVDLH